MSPLFSKSLKTFFALAAAAACIFPCHTKAQSEPAAKAKHKVLFLGNSITKHGPSAKIEWTGDWGMAATALEKDYVHLVIKGISEWNAEAPDALIKNIADFERDHIKYDISAKLKDAQEFKPDLVILCIGENIPALKTDEDKASIKAAITTLLQFVKGEGNPRIMIRSPFWSNAAKEEVFRSICTDMGAIYVDISELGKDESNYGRSEKPWKNAGVGNHPGDKGMKAIADAILKAIPN